MKIHKAQALGHLKYLWWWALDYAPKGDLSAFASAEISAAAEWPGDCEFFVTQLTKNSWINPDMTLHDWQNYGGNWQRKKELNRLRQGRFRKNVSSQWLKIKTIILDRDNHSCGYCGKQATWVDHITPITRGGKTTDENLVACCKSCNMKKSDKTPSEANMKLIVDMSRVTNTNRVGVTNTATVQYSTEHNSTVQTTPPISPQGDGIPEDLQINREEIATWLAYKRERREGYKPSGLGALWGVLRRIPPEQRKQAIEQSMASGYKGIFPPKGGKDVRDDSSANYIPGKYAD